MRVNCKRIDCVAPIWLRAGDKSGHDVALIATLGLGDGVRMPKRITQEQRDAVLHMLAEGHDRDSIAAMVGVMLGQAPTEPKTRAPRIIWNQLAALAPLSNVVLIICFSGFNVASRECSWRGKSSAGRIVELDDRMID